MFVYNHVSIIAAYRFQIAGYRDEIEYKAFRRVDEVSIFQLSTSNQRFSIQQYKWFPLEATRP